MEHDISTTAKVKEFFGYSSKRLHDLNLALQQMLPTWEGLCVDECRKEGVASEAVKEIHELHHCIRGWAVVDDESSKESCFKKVHCIYYCYFGYYYYYG